MFIHSYTSILLSSAIEQFFSVGKDMLKPGLRTRSILTEFKFEFKSYLQVRVQV